MKNGEMHESVSKFILETHPHLLDRIKSGELTMVEIVDSTDKDFEAMARADSGHKILLKGIDIYKEIASKNVIVMRTHKWELIKSRRDLETSWYGGAEGSLSKEQIDSIRRKYGKS